VKNKNEKEPKKETNVVMLRFVEKTNASNYKKDPA